MKEITEITNILVKAVENSACCEEDVARDIVNHLQSKGWRSGEEVEEYKKHIDALDCVIHSLQDRSDGICPVCGQDDPSSQISETCPDCGGSGLHHCNNQCPKQHLCSDGEGPKEAKDCPPCPTCLDGKVWAWVRCPMKDTLECADLVEDGKCACNGGLIPLTNEMALERAGKEYKIIKRG